VHRCCERSEDPVIIDELVKLVEALTYDFSIETIFAGHHELELSKLQADEKAILVRFLAGERPELHWKTEREITQQYRPAVNPQPVFDDTDDTDDGDDSFSPNVNRLNAQGRIELSEAGASIVLP
jgi:hypothetical protein